MPLHDDELARRDGEAIEFAASPRRASWVIDDLHARDGHAARGAFRCSIAIPSNAADRAMLAEVLLAGRASVRVADVVAYLRAAIHRAVAGAVASRDVADALGDAGRAEALAATRAAGAGAAFACGVELVGPFELHLDSPSLQADRARAGERARAEADAADRARHLARAADLAAALHAGPGRAAALLAATAEPDRPAALAALVAAGASGVAPRPLYVVAGRQLARFHLSADPRATTLPTIAPLGESLGALRSVGRADVDGRPHLLVGGQAGVALIALPDNGDGQPANWDAEPHAVIYPDDDPAARLGFNAVAYRAADDTLWATHSERGVACWRRGQTGAPPVVIAPPTIDGQPLACRHAVALDADAVAWAAGGRVCVDAGDGPRDAFARDRSGVVGLVPDGPRLHAVYDDGEWVTIERGTWRTLGRQATGAPVTAAAALPWAGGVRLLLARRDGAVDCLGTDDALVTRYATRHVGPRAVAASAAWVVAMTNDRQRLIAWPTADGRPPGVEIHVASLTGHRAAGVCFG